jgi:NADH-quinone oxidoreductase subunit E
MWGGHVDTSTATTRNTANRLVEVEEILARRGRTPTELIGVLQDIQERWHYLPEDALNYVATTLGMSVNTVFGVATFYAQFSLEPKGKYLVRICDGTACHVKGSTPIYEAMKKKLDLRDGRVTTADGLFTLETVACVGACGIAPVMVINDQVHSQLTPEAAVMIIDTLMAREQDGADSSDEVEPR